MLNHEGFRAAGGERRSASGAWRKVSTTARALEQLRSAGLTKDRTYHGHVYHNCFVGSEAVTWMMDNLPSCADGEGGGGRAAAVALGNQMMEGGVVTHRRRDKHDGMESTHRFEDSNRFYCFCAEIGSHSQNFQTDYGVSSDDKKGRRAAAACAQRPPSHARLAAVCS